MTSGEKFVKFIAIALAFGLICAILSSIFTGISFLGLIFNDERMYGVPTGKNINAYIEELNIYVGAADLEVKQGDYLYVESDNDAVKIKENGSVLTISEVKRFFDVNNTKKVTVYVPSNMTFESVNIETGAGWVDISSLTTYEFNLELGAGVAKLSDIKTIESASIDGGAGELKIEDCEFTDLDLDIGVGECTAAFGLKGENEIHCGVSSTDLTLYGYNDNYTVEVDKGIGDVVVDGKTAKDGDVFGTGDSTVDISCGVGEVDVNYELKLY